MTLALSGIHRRWGQNEVLRGAELQLESGMRGFLRGRNGAGKTTLLRIAAGLLDPDAGTVTLNGLQPDRDRRRFQAHLGYLPAGNGGLYARLTVRQNLEFWTALGLLAPAARADALRDALDRFDLRPLEGARVDRISMGQRQRVRLASTFVHNPSVVLLDEPETSLDDEALSLLDTALADHHDRGGASLWCAPTAPAIDVAFDGSWTISAGVTEAS